MWMSELLVISVHSQAHILNGISGHCDDTLCSARYVMIIEKQLLRCVYFSWKIVSGLKSIPKMGLFFFFLSLWGDITVCTLRLEQTTARVLCHPEIVPDHLSNTPVNFTSQTTAVKAHYMLNRGTFPPTSLEAKDMIPNRADGYMWHARLGFLWSHVWREDAETLNHRWFIWARTTVSSAKVLPLTFESKNSYAVVITRRRQTWQKARARMNRSSSFDEATDADDFL